MSTDDIPYEKMKDILDNPDKYTREEKLKAARQAIRLLDSIAHVQHIPSYRKDNGNEEHG